METQEFKLNHTEYDPAFAPLAKSKIVPFCGEHLANKGNKAVPNHVCDLPQTHTGPHHCNCALTWGDVHEWGDVPVIPDGQGYALLFPAKEA